MVGYRHTLRGEMRRGSPHDILSFAFFLIRLSLSHRSFPRGVKIAMMGHGWSAQRRLRCEKGKRERENQSSAKLLFYVRAIETMLDRYVHVKRNEYIISMTTMT